MTVHYAMQSVAQLKHEDNTAKKLRMQSTVGNKISCKSQYPEHRNTNDMRDRTQTKDINYINLNINVIIYRVCQQRTTAVADLA